MRIRLWDIFSIKSPPGVVPKKGTRRDFAEPMRIPESKIAEVTAAADIVQVIGQHVQLKRAGKDFRGVCPFHGDKDPSFYVSPQKGIFHCFGCAAGGSVFNFVMRVENVSFVEAVRILAQRYGVPLAMESGAPRSISEKERLVRTLACAQRYFVEQLKANEAVAGYLTDRGISCDWFDQIGFGYAPESWDGIQAHLTKAGHNVREAATVGLVKPRSSGSGHYDYFRSRVMIPIRDLNGNIVAFGGRIYGEGDPKYLNSPEHPLFRKRNVLYGLDAAREAIRREGRVILVEGYFDQISLRIRGLENVVAPLGTALGTEQVRLVKRFSDQVITVFDGDEAGLRAVRRSLPIFLSEGLDPRCLILTEHKDPDEAVNELGVDEFKRMLDGCSSIIDFFLDDLKARHDVSGIHGRNVALAECIPVLREVAESKERDYLIERFASALKVREVRVRQMLSPQGSAQRQTFSQRKEAPRKTLFDFPADERNIVRGMLLWEGIVDRVLEMGVLKDLEDPVLRSLAEKMVAARERFGLFDAYSFCSSLEDPDTASIVAGWLNPRREEDDLRAEVDGDLAIEESLNRLRKKKLAQRKAEIMERMKRCPPGEREYNDLATELVEVTRVLHK